MTKLTPAEVQADHPIIRQSTLASYDNCARSSLFGLKYSNGWSTTPQARGTLMHAFYAEALRTLMRTGETKMPTEEGMVILREVVRQKNVPWEDRVRVPLAELPIMRMEALKWMKDNTFDIAKIVDVERRLFYAMDTDRGPRILSGQLDVLLFAPPDGAIVIDWKSTWLLPPDNTGKDIDDPARISFEGYFQQRVYGLLVLKGAFTIEDAMARKEVYGSVNRVTLREFYARRGKVRQATLDRHDLEHVEDDIRILIENFDDSLAEPDNPDAWPASPGKGCAWCLKPGACPIEREARGEGAVGNEQQARQYAAEREVADRVKSHRTKALKAWVDVHGPVPVKAAKGRMMLGWGVGKAQNFGTYVPDSSDRGPKDPGLVQSMKASVEEVRRARDEHRSKR